MSVQDFLADVGAKVIADPRVQAAAVQMGAALLETPAAQNTIDRQIDRVSDKAIERFTGLLPLAVAMATDELVKKLAKAVPDIDIPIVSNVYDLTEDIRARLNDATPAGINIPSLTDFIGRLGF
jgi:hypothetical protein